MRRLQSDVANLGRDVSFYRGMLKDRLKQITRILSKPADWKLLPANRALLESVEPELNDMITFLEQTQEKARELQEKLQGQYISIDDLAGVSEPTFWVFTDGEIEEVTREEYERRTGDIEIENLMTMTPAQQWYKIQAEAETLKTMWADETLAKRQREAELYDYERSEGWKNELY